MRQLRIGCGWSQEDFAHRANLDRTYVSGIERGVRNPTLDIVHRLSETLGVPIAELFAEHEQDARTAAAGTPGHTNDGALDARTTGKKAYNPDSERISERSSD